MLAETDQVQPSAGLEAAMDVFTVTSPILIIENVKDAGIDGGVKWFTQIRQFQNAGSQEGDRKRTTCQPGLCLIYGCGHQVKAGDGVATLGQVDGIAPGATTDVEYSGDDLALLS